MGTTVAAVVRNKWEASVCFIVFDAPEVAGTFAAVAPREVVRDLVHVSLMFRQVRSENGEGLILRRPAVPYSTRRTNDVLKIKACPITGELRWAERRRVA